MKPTEKDFEEAYRGVPMFAPTAEEMDHMARMWEFRVAPVTLPAGHPKDIEHELSRLERSRSIGRPAEL